MPTELITENDNVDKAIIQWGCQYLLTHGYTLISTLPEKVKNTPWSYVVRFATSDGYIYLKHTPDLLALEPSITQILHDQFNASVPEIIACNAELNCFLMKDAGRPLREILKNQFNIGWLCNAIDQFTSIQIAVANHINLFLDIGVPDWRLNNFPDLYKTLLSQKEILIADGLSEIEFNQLKALLPTIFNLCKKLSNYSIKQTIVQPDFHDNNMLICDTSKKITIIDLGEIVIAHPFFSLICCLMQLKKHHGLTDEDVAYQQMMDACFKNYMDMETKEHLLEAFAIAKILWHAYEALANIRLMNACDKGKLMLFQPGKLSNLLKALIVECIAIDSGY
jgi:hypothetical protein